MEKEPLPIIDIEPSEHETQSRLKNHLYETPDSTNTPGSTNTCDNISASDSSKAKVQPGSEQKRYYTFSDPEHGDATWQPGSYAGIGARGRVTIRTPETQSASPTNATAARSSASEPCSTKKSPTSCSNTPKKSTDSHKPDFISASSYVHADTIDNNPSNTHPPKNGRLGGVAQLAIGGTIAAIGVPLLVLPGPGLLVIGSGLALAAHGAKRTFTKPKQTPSVG